MEPAGGLPHVGPGGGPTGLVVRRLGGGTLLGRGGLDKACDVHGCGGGGDVVRQGVWVSGVLQAWSQWSVGDFSTAVGLVGGGRPSDVYSSGHSRERARVLRISVCVRAEVREMGIEADVGLTTVLLLLQPKWQALACVPIPILRSSFRVLESS